MNLISLPQIQPIEPSTRISRPIDAITTVSCDAAPLDRPDRDELDERSRRRTRSPSVQREREPVGEPPVDQLPRDVRRERRERALREVDHLGRAVDEDERDREARVDAAVREAGDRLLREQRALQRADDQEDAARDERRPARSTRCSGECHAARWLMESAAISTPGSCGRIVSCDASSSLVPSNATCPTSST